MTMSYTTLVAARTTYGSIANWMNHSDLQSAAATIVEEAEAFIYRRLRHWRMVTEATGVFTASSSVDTITLPSDYIEDKIFKIAGLVSGVGVFNQNLSRKTIQEVKESYNYDSSGNRVQAMPQTYYTLGGATPKLKFDSPANYAYPYELTYYQQPAALGVSNTTNFITTFYPRLMRTACMVGAAEFMKDAGVGNYDRTYWVSETEKELAIAQMESDAQGKNIEIGAIIT